jgi:ribosomal protein S3
LPPEVLKKRYNFFKKATNIILNCITNNKCSKSLAYLIITQLKILGKFKRQNFFLGFVKEALKSFKHGSYSKIKGIKIQIKGRLNGRPRSKKKTIKIANDISLIRLDSVVDYSNQTAFTSNGTLGVKI